MDKIMRSRRRSKGKAAGLVVLLRPADGGALLIQILSILFILSNVPLRSPRSPR